MHELWFRCRLPGDYRFGGRAYDFLDLAAEHAFDAVERFEEMVIGGEETGLDGLLERIEVSGPYSEDELRALPAECRPDEDEEANPHEAAG